MVRTILSLALALGALPAAAQPLEMERNRINLENQRLEQRLNTLDRQREQRALARTMRERTVRAQDRLRLDGMRTLGNRPVVVTPRIGR